MLSDFPRSTARAIKGAAWLGLAGIGVIAASCGGDGSTASEGAGAASSSADSSSTSSASGGGTASSSSAGGSGAASSSSSSSGAGGGPGGHLADWVRTFLGSEQSASSVSTDPQGNIYVGG